VSGTTAIFIVMPIVVMPCLFLMALMPFVVDSREVRKSRRFLAAQVEGRHPLQVGDNYPGDGERRISGLGGPQVREATGEGDRGPRSG
jgi:hypothetical protein